MSWRDFFRQVYGKEGKPFPYQSRLAEGPWPDALAVPTGLGKTAAVVLAWLHKRLNSDPQTPRRLVYCLPMRALVEQVARNVERWLENSAPLFEARGLMPPKRFVLMGGEADEEWVLSPEQPAVLVGTQDMLLSRALMRGYGMSRYAWPVDFALLHNDALWVFDEVQLMGAGLATSAQLEGLRRSEDLPPARPCRSLWLSATLRTEWLETVDLRSHLPLAVQGLAEEDKKIPVVRARIEAPKTLVRASVRLNDGSERGLNSYASTFAVEIATAHRALKGAVTLVFLNQVERAQGIYGELTKKFEGEETELLLVHARFRPAERRGRERRLQQLKELKKKNGLPPGGAIVISTQALEAGVDFSSDILFTELARWSSLVQRFGRCNRYGERKDAQIYWVDIDAEEKDLILPYKAEELAAIRERLGNLKSASPKDLGSSENDLPSAQVLRRKDLVELFNTEPDLTGFDIDVSSYIRDAEESDIQVFWRSFEGKPVPDALRPAREELCPVPIGRFRAFLKNIWKREHSAFVWDSLERAWVRSDPTRLRPGLTIMLPAEAGGYSNEVGFDPGLKVRVDPLEVSDKEPPEGNDDDHAAGRWISLPEHTENVVREVEALCEVLSEERYVEALLRSARWHDTGKAHSVFQDAALKETGDDGPLATLGLIAKSIRKMPRYERRGFRHELASALLWLAHGDEEEKDLVAYLIAAHHGKVRFAIRALPTEKEPPESDRRFARGIWDGDILPALSIPGVGEIPKTTLSLEIMELGDGAMGESWSARTQRLLKRFGPFRLAWYEALLRIADRRTSAKEAEENGRAP